MDKRKAFTPLEASPVRSKSDSGNVVASVGVSNGANPD